MTEHDWLLLRSPSELAAELSAVPRAQPLYLFAAAVLRRAWEYLPAESWRFAVEATERFARGRTTLRDFTEAWVNAEADTGDVPTSEYRWCCPCCDTDWATGDAAAKLDRRMIDNWLRAPATVAAESAFAALRVLVDVGVCRANDPRWVEERRAQHDLYLDLLTAPSGLRDATRLVRSCPGLSRLLQALDRQPALGRLDLLALADALEEAGCEDRTLLAHCRSSSPHFPGCWAIEHLAGRAARGCGNGGR